MFEPEPSLKVDLDVRVEDFREALRALFRQVGYSYSIDPRVQGKVSLTVHGGEFKDVLRQLTQQVGATLARDQGIYVIKPLRIRIGGGPIDDGWIAYPPPSVAQNDAHIFLYRSGIVFKLDKKDLKTLASRRLHD